MVEIHYLDSASREQVITYPTYEEYRLAQMSCMVAIQDHFKVVKVMIDGETIDYNGNFGNLFYFLDKR